MVVRQTDKTLVGCQLGVAAVWRIFSPHYLVYEGVRCDQSGDGCAQESDRATHWTLLGLAEDGDRSGVYDEEAGTPVTSLLLYLHNAGSTQNNFYQSLREIVFSCHDQHWNVLTLYLTLVLRLRLRCVGLLLKTFNSLVLFSILLFLPL